MLTLRTRIPTDVFGRRRTAASASKRPAAQAPARATVDNKKRTSAFRFMGHLAVGVAPIYHRRARGRYFLWGSILRGILASGTPPGTCLSPQRGCHVRRAWCVPAVVRTPVDRAAAGGTVRPDGPTRVSC